VDRRNKLSGKAALSFILIGWWNLVILSGITFCSNKLDNDVDDGRNLGDGLFETGLSMEANKVI
jgi:hypothetical protein